MKEINKQILSDEINLFISALTAAVGEYDKIACCHELWKYINKYVDYIKFLFQNTFFKVIKNKAIEFRIHTGYINFHTLNDKIYEHFEEY